MSKTILRLVGVIVLLSPMVGLAQNRKATEAYYITKEEVDKVNSQPGVDRTIRVYDIGDQHFSVGIVHRGKSGASAPAPAAPAAAPAAPAAGTQPCGDMSGSLTFSGASGIAHDKQTEGYYIVSGAGTMITGGTIMNGRTSAPNSEVTTTLNGPSCSGRIGGTIQRRPVKPGDIVIIPAGVPHGWGDIPDHVDYLSFRPSADTLTVGYEHPSLKK